MLFEEVAVAVAGIGLGLAVNKIAGAKGVWIENAGGNEGVRTEKNAAVDGLRSVGLNMRTNFEAGPGGNPEKLPKAEAAVVKPEEILGVCTNGCFEVAGRQFVGHNQAILSFAQSGNHDAVEGHTAVSEKIGVVAGVICTDGSRSQSIR